MKLCEKFEKCDTLRHNATLCDTFSCDILKKIVIHFGYNRQVVRNFDLPVIERLKFFHLFLLCPVHDSLLGGDFYEGNVKPN